MIEWIHNAMAAHPFWGVVVILLLLAASQASPHQFDEKTGKQNNIDNFFSWIAFFSAIFLVIVWIGG